MINAAVICELNPAHNGHKYIFDEIRKRSGADNLIALMSGNYVQRGEPALVDKYVRTRMALMMGADLVLELPSPFSHQSAREFAMAGVALARATGIVDVLGFGVESSSETDADHENADISLGLLSQAADILSDEPPAYKEALDKALRSGLSYPAASEQALGACGVANAASISSPNNILAREYLRAIKLLGADIEPVAIKRLGDGYNESSPKDGTFASATALRKLLISSVPMETISTYIPSELSTIYEELIRGDIPLICSEDLCAMLSLRLMSIIREGVRPYIFDIPEDLYNSIMRDAERPLIFSERIMNAKSKAYTYTRISRALLNLVLGVSGKEAADLKADGYVPYIRVLGFRQKVSGLLSALKEHASAPIISNAADKRKLLHHSIFYDNVYYSLVSAKSGKGSNIKNEYERQMIII